MTKVSEIIHLPIGRNDTCAKTVGEYLKILLQTLWAEEESFSGKRPFGNSGWKNVVYVSLIKEGFVKGEVDEDDLLDEVDEESADNLIDDVIEYIFAKGEM